MTLTLAQLVPVVCTAFAAAVMVRLGTAKKLLVVRRPAHCTTCGVERRRCRCAS
jgi:hypothetical protein